MRELSHAKVGHRSVPRSRQQGVTLVFVLVAVVVLLISSVAIVQSFNTSLSMSGNIAFKRDLQNQADRAVAITQAAFSASGAASGTPGAFSSRSARAANSISNAAAINYSATVLSSVDLQGVPLILTRSDYTDPASGFKLNPAYDLTSANDPSIGPSVTLRFVVDRLCVLAGDEKTLGAMQCSVQGTPPTGSSTSVVKNAGSVPLCSTCQSAIPQLTLYRLSVRIIGPRKTQSFFQSTFAVPS